MVCHFLALERETQLTKPALRTAGHAKQILIVLVFLNALGVGGLFVIVALAVVGANAAPTPNIATQPTTLRRRLNLFVRAYMLDLLRDPIWQFLGAALTVLVTGKGVRSFIITSTFF